MSDIYPISLLLGTTYPFDIDDAIHVTLGQLIPSIGEKQTNIYPDQISILGFNWATLPHGTYYLSNGSRFNFSISVQEGRENDYVTFGAFEYIDKTTGLYTNKGSKSFSFGALHSGQHISLFIDDYVGQGNVDEKTGYYYSLNPSKMFGCIKRSSIDPLYYTYADFYNINDLSSGFTKEFLTNFFDGALYEQGPPFPVSDNDIGVGLSDNSSDDIDFPPLPTVDILGTGFVRAYQPTQEQLVELSNYLWSEAFSLDTLKKLFADPMESLIGLSMIPVNPSVAENQNILFGNITTDITANKILSQYVIFDCGEITLNEYFGGSLDYDPYTHIDIYLPFINIQTLNTNDVMNAKLHLKYYIDIVTGSCVALLKVDKKKFNDNLNSIIYSWNGNCAMQIPVSASDNTSYLQSVLGITASIATTAVTAYATKGASVAAQAKMKTAQEVAQSYSMTQAALTGSVIGTAESVAGGVSQMHTTIQRGGTISGNLGFISTLRPYIIITRPKQCFPRNFNTFEGQPSYVTNTLGYLSGYTKVYSIHLQNITATVEELNEIETLLKNGVIL